MLWKLFYLKINILNYYYQLHGEYYLEKIKKLWYKVEKEHPIKIEEDGVYIWTRYIYIIVDDEIIYNEDIEQWVSF